MDQPVIIIRVVDLETTGFEPPEVPIELGWCDIICSIDPPVFEVCGTGTATYVDPDGRAISPQSAAVHHIQAPDLGGAPKWTDALHQMLADPVPTMLAAHHAKFEQQWLTPDLVRGLPWICSLKCARRLWPELKSHSNGALRYERGLNVVRSIADQSHRAGPDAYVTAHLIVDMLSAASLDQLLEWTTQPALLHEISFGKHRGTLWGDAPTDYLQWIMRQDFDEDVRFTAQHWLDRRASA